MKAHLRILVADDFDLMRLGLRRFLDVTFKGALVEEAVNGKQTLDFVRQKPWDLLLLDLSLPDKNGLDILQDVKLGLCGNAVALPVVLLRERRRQPTAAGGGQC